MSRAPSLDACQSDQIGRSIDTTLTLGALNVTEETGRQILPSATGFAARQAIAVLRKHNLPIAPLLNRAGVSEDDIDNRQRRISALAQGKLLEYAGEALGDHVFGLHLAQHANPREAGLFFYVASAAEDIGVGLPRHFAWQNT